MTECIRPRGRLQEYYLNGDSSRHQKQHQNLNDSGNPRSRMSYCELITHQSSSAYYQLSRRCKHHSRFIEAQRPFSVTLQPISCTFDIMRTPDLIHNLPRDHTSIPLRTGNPHASSSSYHRSVADTPSTNSITYSKKSADHHAPTPPD
jgi:hypothetical protein